MEILIFMIFEKKDVVEKTYALTIHFPLSLQEKSFLAMSFYDKFFIVAKNNKSLRKHPLLVKFRYRK